MSPHGGIGIVLANTGSPAAPTPRAVRAYLRRFLTHPRIAPMASFPWKLILNLFILPKRGRASADKYRSIWTDEGAPLAVNSAKLAAAVQDALRAEGVRAHVRVAMSFGDPTMRDALDGLRRAGCDRLVVLPMYPQSAFSTTGVVKDQIDELLDGWDVPCAVVGDYHDNPMYVRAVARSIEHAGFDAASSDKLLFSYHSIPLADIEAGDTYELQASASSLQIAGELGIDRKRWTIAYQCRFDKGRDWLAPFTRDALARWASTGADRVFVVCPNFAMDCLETTYDICRVQKSAYCRMLGEHGFKPRPDSFVYVPCLDKTKAHVRVICDVLRPYVSEDKPWENRRPL